jgi:protein-S-isoprenylcysteine O-methyltransferase Ste14
MRLGAKALIRFSMMVLLLSAALFVSAGTLKWPMAWAYVALTLTAVFGSRLLVLRRSPDLLAERGSYLEQQGAKSWDRALVPVVGLYGPVVGLIVSGLDRRFGWSPPLPPALKVAAFVVLALGSALGAWAMAENKFFSAVVRIQKDRGHTVIDTGPYRFVRHPGYVGGVLGYLAGPLALGSLWALVPGLLTTCVVVIRTALEDRTLLDELDGYKEYAQRMRYRLFPGIW